VNQGKLDPTYKLVYLGLISKRSKSSGCDCRAYLKTTAVLGSTAAYQTAGFPRPTKRYACISCTSRKLHYKVKCWWELHNRTFSEAVLSHLFLPLLGVFLILVPSAPAVKLFIRTGK